MTNYNLKGGTNKKMNKLMNKKINMFGKEVSVFALVAVAMIGLATAALIPYFGLITGHVTVTQGLLVDGLSVQTGSGNIQDSYDNFTSRSEEHTSELQSH